MSCPNWQATARSSAAPAQPIPTAPPYVPPHPPPPDIAPPPSAYPPPPPILSPPTSLRLTTRLLDEHLHTQEHAHPASAIDVDVSAFDGILEAVNSTIQTAQAIAAELDQHQHDDLYAASLDGGLF